MILPDKLTVTKKSLIYKGINILSCINSTSSLDTLYEYCRIYVDDFNDFIKVLTVLYAIGYIEIKEGMIIKL
ncbi:ABC-three component system middle component 7 [Paenilisteria newyorkensis]|uniref:ABC-three component system middle component 7 n=1 Tax=Listeria newyorkensis TaxID=1497681 RepID=UPI0007413685